MLVRAEGSRLEPGGAPLPGRLRAVKRSLRRCSVSGAAGTGRRATQAREFLCVAVGPSAWGHRNVHAQLTLGSRLRSHL